MCNRRHFLKTSLLASSALSLSSTKVFSQAALMAQDYAAGRAKQLSNKKPLTILYPQGCLANLNNICKKFTADTGVEIILQETGLSDISSDLIFNSLQNQFLCDIALPASFWIPDLADAKAILPLNEFVQAHEPPNFRDSMLYQYADEFDGKFYGYQTDGDTYMMFYNRNMLDNENNQKNFQDSFGYPLTVPSTWQQLDQMIQFFHKPDQQQYGGCLFRAPGFAAWEWWSRFHAKGYYPLNNELEPQINNNAGIDALTELIAINQYLHPNVYKDGLFENWQTFSEGETFCNIGWGGTQKALNKPQSAVKDQMYFSPTPGGIVNGQAVNSSIFNWGWNYVVSPLSKNPELAYLFTLYCSSPVISTLSVQEDGYFDPFREEHYLDQAIIDIYSKPFLDAHKTSMKQSMPDFYLRNQSAYLTSLQENIFLAIKGNLTPKQALDTAANEWRLITRKVGREKQMQYWLAIKEKYPEISKRVLQ